MGPLSTAEVARFWARIDKGAPTHPTLGTRCWDWTGARNVDGYGKAKLSNRWLLAHRTAWILTNGPIPSLTSGLENCVLHRCDRPRCCNPEHLFLGTRSENNADKVTKGREAHGESNGRSIFTTVDVWLIRAAAAHGARSAEIAEWFGVSLRGIQHLVGGHRWRKAPGAIAAPRPSPKLNLALAEEIRALCRAGESQQAVARRFGVVRATVGHVVTGRSWK